MSNTARIVSLTVFTLALTLAACTGGGGGGGAGGGAGGGGAASVSGDNEDKYTQALVSINKTWKVTEMKKEKDSTIIRVEAEENVSLPEVKKAAEAIQKVDPKFNGSLEFFSAQLGMVLRKWPIEPAI